MDGWIANINQTGGNVLVCAICDQALFDRQLSANKDSFCVLLVA